VGSKYVSAHSNLGASPSASGYRKKGGQNQAVERFAEVDNNQNSPVGWALGSLLGFLLIAGQTS